MIASVQTKSQLDTAQDNAPVVVVKVGGSVLKSEANLAIVVDQITQLAEMGFRLAIVHGGGSHISECLQSQGIQSQFADGLRITDEKTLMAAYSALGHVNSMITEALKNKGVAAVGLHAEPNLFTCKKKSLKSTDTDLGWVGEVCSVDLKSLQDASVFVISPIGSDKFQNRYNINADDAALALAVALEAESLVFASDVPGVLMNGSEPSSLVSWLDCASALELINSGRVTGGMIPKLVSSIAAVKAGVKKVSIISGKKSTALVDLLAGQACVGTTIFSDKFGRLAGRGGAHADSHKLILKQIA